MSKIRLSYRAVKAQHRPKSLTYHIVAVESWPPGWTGVARKLTLCGVTASKTGPSEPVHYVNCHRCRRAARSLGIDLLPPRPAIPEPGDAHGMILVPGYNVDKVDIHAGLRFAVDFGYDSPEHQMVVEYALMRHKKGEEKGAQDSALSGGIDLTSWYAILAAALAVGQGQS